MSVRGRRASEREAGAWAVTLDEALQHGMWRGVGQLGHIPANSQALLRKRGYKELLRFDLSLRMSLALAWRQGAELADGLIGDVRQSTKSTNTGASSYCAKCCLECALS